jgi:hypothetical protein
LKNDFRVVRYYTFEGGANLGTPELSKNDSMRARRGISDTYRRERKYDKARRLYQALLDEVGGSANPHEVHRLELTDRLDAIKGLAEGEAEKPSRRKQRVECINRSKHALYVSPDGDDGNPGTKDSLDSGAFSWKIRTSIVRPKSGEGWRPSFAEPFRGVLVEIATSPEPV